MISAGRMDRRIIIQQRTDTEDARGELVPTWATWATVWAQKQPLRGREFFSAGQMQTPADVRYRIRWRAGVLPTMRVLDGGVPHDIVGDPIDVDGAGVVLELMCTTGVRDGR